METKLDAIEAATRALQDMLSDSGGIREGVNPQEVVVALNSWTLALNPRTVLELCMDSRRLRWLLPIVTGTSGHVADSRANALALQLLAGRDGVDAVDMAMSREDATP